MKTDRKTRYCESIDILYSNIVHIRQDVGIVPVLGAVLPPRRSLSLRRLEVSCEFPNSHWDSFCQSLQHLSKLEYCQIWLFGRHPAGLLTPPETCQALEPLRTMPRMREFRVFLAVQDLTDVTEKFSDAAFWLGLCEPISISIPACCGVGEYCGP